MHCIRAVIAHLLASRFPQPNAFGAKVQVFSQLNISVWRAYLTNYADTNVADFLEFGWPINYGAGVLPSSTCQNHQSALDYFDVVNHYLQTELSYGAIFGPFQYNPLHEDLITSPLQTVTKRGSTKRRVVMDLSFPSSASVNDGISKTHYLDTVFQLRLPGIDRLRDFIIEKGPGCFVFKKDLKRAYRQFPIVLKDYKFLGFFWDNALYFDTRCPFGLRSSAMICQRTTRAVIYIFTQEARVFQLTYIWTIFMVPSIPQSNPPLLSDSRIYLTNWVYNPHQKRIVHLRLRWFVSAFSLTLRAWYLKSHRTDYSSFTRNYYSGQPLPISRNVSYNRS